MALIEFEDYPSTNTPYNSENINHNFKELDKRNIHSTEEQIIGTWFGKILYRKGFTLTPTSSLYSFDLSTEHIIDYRGHFDMVETIECVLGKSSSYENSGQNTRIIRIDETTCRLDVPSNWVGHEYTFTVDYTKITD